MVYSFYYDLNFQYLNNEGYQQPYSQTDSSVEIVEVIEKKQNLSSEQIDQKVPKQKCKKDKKKKKADIKKYPIPSQGKQLTVMGAGYLTAVTISNFLPGSIPELLATDMNTSYIKNGFRVLDLNEKGESLGKGYTKAKYIGLGLFPFGALAVDGLCYLSFSQTVNAFLHAVQPVKSVGKRLLKQLQLGLTEKTGKPKDDEEEDQKVNLQKAPSRIKQLGGMAGWTALTTALAYFFPNNLLMKYIGIGFTSASYQNFVRGIIEEKASPFKDKVKSIEGIEEVILQIEEKMKAAEQEISDSIPSKVKELKKFSDEISELPNLYLIQDLQVTTEIEKKMEICQTGFDKIKSSKLSHKADICKLINEIYGIFFKFHALSKTLKLFKKECALLKKIDVYKNKESPISPVILLEDGVETLDYKLPKQARELIEKANNQSGKEQIKILLQAFTMMLDILNLKKKIEEMNIYIDKDWQKELDDYVKATNCELPKEILKALLIDLQQEREIERKKQILLEIAKQLPNLDQSNLLNLRNALNDWFNALEQDQGNHQDIEVHQQAIRDSILKALKLHLKDLSEKRQKQERKIVDFIEKSWLEAYKTPLAFACITALIGIGYGIDQLSLKTLGFNPDTSLVMTQVEQKTIERQTKMGILNKGLGVHDLNYKQPCYWPYQAIAIGCPLGAYLLFSGLNAHLLLQMYAIRLLTSNVGFVLRANDNKKGEAPKTSLNVLSVALPIIGIAVDKGIQYGTGWDPKLFYAGLSILGSRITRLLKLGQHGHIQEPIAYVCEKVKNVYETISLNFHRTPVHSIEMSDRLQIENFQKEEAVLPQENDHSLSTVGVVDQPKEVVVEILENVQEGEPPLSTTLETTPLHVSDLPEESSIAIEIPEQLSKKEENSMVLDGSFRASFSRATRTMINLPYNCVSQLWGRIFK